LISPARSKRGDANFLASRSALHESTQWDLGKKYAPRLAGLNQVLHRKVCEFCHSRWYEVSATAFEHPKGRKQHTAKLFDNWEIVCNVDFLQQPVSDGEEADEESTGALSAE
jgi:hypothetical protein